MSGRHHMSAEFIKYVSYLEDQQEEMTRLLEEWVSINSGSDNLQGLEKMFRALEIKFSQFGAKIEKIPPPLTLKS